MIAAKGSRTPTLALIAAVARNGVIGTGNALPWRLPADLRHFKEITMGRPLLMGRKTYESIGRPLPGRPTTVLSRDPTFRPAGVEVVASLDDALHSAAAAARGLGVEEVMVAGGGELYRALIGQAARLYITEVDLDPDGDTTFPPIASTQWRSVSREAPSSAGTGEPALAFVVYERL